MSPRKVASRTKLIAVAVLTWSGITGQHWGWSWELEPGLDWGVWSRGWSWGEARVRQGWGRVGGVSKQEVIDEMLLMENPLLQEFR
jgi:hypothetical protein